MTAFSPGKHRVTVASSRALPASLTPRRGLSPFPSCHILMNRQSALLRPASGQLASRCRRPCPRGGFEGVLYPGQTISLWRSPARDRPRPGCAETRENLHPPARRGRLVSPDSSPPPAGLLDVECHILRKRLIELPGHPYLEEKHPLHRRDTEIPLVIDLRLDDVTEKVNRAGLGA